MRFLKFFKFGLMTLCLFSIFISCNHYTKVTSNVKQVSCTVEKIKFDITKLDKLGLIGSEDGKVAVNFEFCIPNTETCIAQVFSIDSTLVSQKSSGRSACAKNQLLIIGTTFNKDYKRILCELTKFDFITEINQNYSE